ncbi:hypothetical protein BDB01DRAFT_807120 [Pilobolus umbonatus]|nr:hypothetical protein BDB01DRAFT_807120 [Pilobolus umbonatus]
MLRPRRYTLSRPDSAIDLITEDSDQLDRISGRLHALIKEANHAVQNKKKKNKARPVSCPASNSYQPITESFERIDHSISEIDSLSRDLAPPPHLDTRYLPALLLIPFLLHIPHTFILFMFDAATKEDASSSVSPFIAFLCIWLFTHIMIHTNRQKKPKKSMDTRRKSY